MSPPLRDAQNEPADAGLLARNAADLVIPDQILMDRILVNHQPRDQILGRISCIVEYLQNIPEQKAVNRDGIYTVQLHRIFQEDTMLLGFVRRYCT